MSKGLEALNVLLEIKTKSNYDDVEYLCNEYPDEFNAIRYELKALEIIKKKFVSYPLLLSSDNFQEFKNKVKGTNLTQEEFDLLKEVLEE